MAGIRKAQVPVVKAGGATQKPSAPHLRLPAMQPIKPNVASTRLYGKSGLNADNGGADPNPLLGPPGPQV